MDIELVLYRCMGLLGVIFLLSVIVFGTILVLVDKFKPSPNTGYLNLTGLNDGTTFNGNFENLMIEGFKYPPLSGSFMYSNGALYDTRKKLIVPLEDK